MFATVTCPSFADSTVFDISNNTLSTVMDFFSDSNTAGKLNLVIKKASFGYGDLQPATTYWGTGGVFPNSIANDFSGWIVFDKVKRRKVFLHVSKKYPTTLQMITIRGAVGGIDKCRGASTSYKAFNLVTCSSTIGGEQHLVNAELTAFFAPIKETHNEAPEVTRLIDELRRMFGAKICVSRFRYDALPPVYKAKLTLPIGTYFTEIYPDRAKLPKILLSNYVDGDGLINVSIVENCREVPEWNMYSATGAGYHKCLKFDEQLTAKICALIKRA